MSIEVRSTAAAAAQSGVGETLSAESRPGDLAVIFMSGQFPAGDNTLPTLTGWDQQTVLNVNNRSGYVATRRVTAPSQTQDVSWYATNAAWKARQNGVLVVLSGADVGSTMTWQGDPPTVEGVTLLASQQHGANVVSMNAWEAGTILAAGADRKDASWSTLRVAMTDAAPGEDLSGPAAWASVALAPATPHVVTHDAEVDGTGADVYVWDGASEVLARMRPMPRGARTVQELLARDQFIVAHRGGSKSWPEHTERAYTQAVAHGCDALEFSSARTSDGVWIGCHDKTLERLGGPSTPVSELTWGQVQEAMAGTGNMPARLDWLLDTYGESHVIVFDPKYETWGRIPEYTEMLSPWRESILLKGWGDSPDTRRKQQEAGFFTWGFAYAADADKAWWGDFVKGVALDVLSMEWSASSDVWAQATGSGKPVVTHIPATAEQVRAGWEKGASGAIVAGVSAYLTPRV